MYTDMAFELTFEWWVVWKEKAGEEHWAQRMTGVKSEGDMAK